MQRIYSNRPSIWHTFQVLLTVLLLCTAAARWIDSNGGKTLIHKVPVEIDEQTYIIGKIYRPLSAQSLNQRPAIILLNAISDDVETNSPLAIELAKRGFVALSLENRARYAGDHRKPLDIAELLQAGHDFLESQPFVREGMIGLAVINLPAHISIQPAELVGFRKIAAIESAPLAGASQLNRSTIPIWTASGVVQAVLENLYDGLQIQNDENLWISPSMQSAVLREALLLIAFVVLLAAIPLLFLILRQIIVKICCRASFLPTLAIHLCAVFLSLVMVWLLTWSFSRIFMTEFRFFASGLRPLTIDRFTNLLKWLPAGVMLFSFQGFAIKKFGFWKTMLCMILFLLSALLIFAMLTKNSATLNQADTNLNLVSIRWCAIFLIVITWFIFSGFQKYLLKHETHSIAIIALCSTITTWVYISNLAIMNLK